MKLLINDGSGTKPVAGMSFAQNKQAAAVMDCIGRLIPQEGIDYDVEIIFKSEYDPQIAINLVAHTDKGEWWKEYVSKMINKYPPQVKNPDPAIQEEEEGESNDSDSSHANEPEDAHYTQESQVKENSNA